MDSLLASYASSDEEEDHLDFSSKTKSGETCKLSQTSDIVSSLLSLPQPNLSSSRTHPPPNSQPKPLTGSPSYPQPKSPSSFPSPTQPKSSVFASLPPPTSSSSVTFHALATSDNSHVPSSASKPKRVVQFRPPIMLKPPNDEDDDEEEKEKKPIKEPVSSNSASSLSSFFSSLPAPKNTLGSGSAPALGAARRSIVETVGLTSNYNDKKMENKGAHTDLSQQSYAGNLVDGSSTTLVSETLTTGTDPSNWISNNENYGSYGHYEDSGSYDIAYENYGVSTMASPALAPENSGYFENVTKVPGKRGRNEMPGEIIEVKQDELMKNRPREDQVKSTGIAFGPAYQPVSTKGKPSKLHKRKHQIGSLYFDMRQKEQELAERRSKGFLTKAETQAKYGW